MAVKTVYEGLVGDIRSYIKGHNVCTLAVADGNSPSAHTVYYISDENFRIYFESNPDSDKVRVLKNNPKVSIAIDEDYRNWKEIRGVQLFGRARIVDSREDSQLKEVYRKKFPQINELGGIPKHHVFVEITPEKIYYLDFTKEFGHKSVFFPETSKQGFLSKINW
jgi:nitroimidazol reductase NimA-like FMN-containing flavoprotein (pyridoxamine 5'-phosphate oxidase superfamily)